MLAFFSDGIKSKQISIDSLPLDGFSVIRSLFISQNASAGNFEELPRISRKKQPFIEVQADDADFTVKVASNQIDNLGMLWDIVLSSSDAQVLQQSLGVLVNCYLSVDSRQIAEKSSELVREIFDKISESQASGNSAMTTRLLLVLQSVITTSEKLTGTSVQPHSALLKGELLDELTVRYQTKDRASYNRRQFIDREFVVSANTLSTVWQLKQQIAMVLGMDHTHLKLSLANGTTLLDCTHGDVLGKYGIVNGDCIIVERRTSRKKFVRT